jgi:hypothetical protein
MPPPFDGTNSGGGANSEVESEEFEGNADFPDSQDLDDGKPPKKKHGKGYTRVNSDDDVKRAKEFAKVQKRYAEMASAAHDGRTTTGLRKGYGITLLAVLGGQLLIVDWIFYKFLEGLSFKVSDTVMVTFLTSVVVEVIGLVAIVATSLFKAPAPLSNGKPPKPAKDAADQGSNKQ